jgi:hypothetical protein
MLIDLMDFFRRTPQSHLMGSLRGEIEGLVPVPDRLAQALNDLTLEAKGV